MRNPAFIPLLKGRGRVARLFFVVCFLLFNLFVSAFASTFTSTFASNSEDLNAQSVSVKTVSISLREAITRTLANNPELSAFEYQRKIQDGRVLQASLAPAPVLSVSLEDFLGSGEKQVMDGAQATVSVGWVLEHGIRQRTLTVA